MGTIDVIFLLIAVVPLSMALGAWAQKVIIYLEDLRGEKAHRKTIKYKE